MVSIDNEVSTKSPAKETLLTPRFYTTDFEEMGSLSISSNKYEILSVISEFRLDYNKKHFIRDKEFITSWKEFDSKTRELFIEFLERSCTAEFSGFLLYKELSRSLKDKNPILAEGFALMSRDEARHAGFLNKAMSDFNLTLDLGFLTKSRKYTFFAPKFIFYATYLSEKIGYWRYITIYRFLEQYPEYRIYPLFRFFESWCQDENRHGDFFAAVLRSQPHLITGLVSELWCRFFLLSVFITMYLNDNQRAGFYASIGLNARQFDQYVIIKTNDSAKNVFPVILDVTNPIFFDLLDKACEMNNLLINLEKDATMSLFQKTFVKAKTYLTLGLYFGRLSLLAPIKTEDKWYHYKAN
mmetsp:Transcript_15564/g.52794  ORF Transcript_15564/g.52794 Transcript_15564/m.52794 type:complete len:355 (-) Transcript_15564:2170-3234(-)